MKDRKVRKSQDPKRTPQAKRATINRKQLRALKHATR